MPERRTRSGLAVVILSLLPALAPAQVAAQERDEIRAAIRNVLAAPEFDTRRESYEIRYVGEPLDLFGDDDDGDDPERDYAWLETLATLIARFFEYAAWALVVLALCFLIVRRAQWLHWFRVRPTTPRDPRSAIVIGELVIDPDSLPQDIPAHVLAQWRAGDRRGALSLLYRGTLHALISRHALELPDSATEAESLRRIRRRMSETIATYSEQLTNVWLAAAYAGRWPQEADVIRLCDAYRDRIERAGQ